MAIELPHDKEDNRDMPTKKEALLNAGRIQAITRGRISTENHKWLAANPDKWDDESTVKVGTSFKAPRAVAAVPKPTHVGIVTDVFYTWPEKEFTAHEVATGKYVGMREVCNTCRVSLVAHSCLNPTVWERIPVKIVPR